MISSANLADWTDDRVETLKKLWLDGLSAGQIAEQLGGVSRNAVIGKASRLGLDRRSQQVAAKPQAVWRPTPRPQAPLSQNAKPEPAQPRGHGALALKFGPTLEPAPLPTLREVLVHSEPVGLLELGSNACKYPVSERDGQQLFCGAHQRSGGNYCDAHHDLAVQPEKPRPFRQPRIKTPYEPPIRSLREVL